MPARHGSRRLPGKPLLLLGGRPLVERVWRRAALVRGVDSLVVATDDERIARVVRGFGGEAVMTSAEHLSGTDRVWEAASDREADVVVNVQGDEPFLDPRTVEAVVEGLLDGGAAMATAAAPLGGDPAGRSVVKVVVDRRGMALYFSRAPIPTGGPFLAHVGVYAFRREALERFARREAGPLEKAEGLEQLRLLEYQEPVRVVMVPAAAPSVDTPEDLARARAILRQE